MIETVMCKKCTLQILISPFNSTTLTLSFPSAIVSNPNVVSNSANGQILSSSNTYCRKQVLNVIQKYSEALELLDSYDHQTMERPKGNAATYKLNYEECMEVISHMRFGAES